MYHRLSCHELKLPWRVENEMSWRLILNDPVGLQPNSHMLPEAKLCVKWPCIFQEVHCSWQQSFILKSWALPWPAIQIQCRMEDIMPSEWQGTWQGSLGSMVFQMDDVKQASRCTCWGFTWNLAGNRSYNWVNSVSHPGNSCFFSTEVSFESGWVAEGLGRLAQISWHVFVGQESLVQRGPPPI